MISLLHLRDSSPTMIQYHLYHQIKILQSWIIYQSLDINVKNL